MTIPISHLLLAFVSGAGIGALFFGGLRWTVRQLPKAKRPSLWVLGSFLLRVCISLAGFYFIMGDRWERLLVGLFGFLVMRILFVHHLSPARVQASEERSVHR